MDHFLQMLHLILRFHNKFSEKAPERMVLCGVGKWGQGAWTHHPLYSRKPRPHGRRQPCIRRPQLGSFPTPALGQYTPPVWPRTGQLWLSTTSDQHWGSLAPPLPSGRSSTLSHGESQPLLFPERKRTEISAYLCGSIVVCTSYMPPLCKDLHRLKLYSCTFLISSYCRLWSQCSDLSFYK